MIVLNASLYTRCREGLGSQFLPAVENYVLEFEIFHLVFQCESKLFASDSLAAIGIGAL